MKAHTSRGYGLGKTIDCINCDYRHLWHLPSKDTIDNYYEEGLLYKEHAPGFLQKEALEHSEGLWDAWYEYNLKLLSYPYTLIDVGCGYPWFLHYYHRQYAIEGIGVEPDKDIISKYVVRSLAECPQAEAIRASLVLEHVLEPYALMREMYDKLPKGGKLLVIVPNDYNPLQLRIKGEYWVSDVHVNYFTPETLRKMFNATGFEILYETATFPMELWTYVGLNYLKYPRKGALAHRLRLRLERITYPHVAYKLLYDLFGIGRELVFLGVKR